MLQKLVHTGMRRMFWTPAVFLLVLALVSMTRTCDPYCRNVGSEEIRAAEYNSHVILHSQREKNSNQYIKTSTEIPVSSSLPKDPLIATPVEVTRTDVLCVALSPLTTTIIVSSFL